MTKPKRPEVRPRKLLRSISDDDLRHVTGGSGGLASAHPPKDPPLPPDPTGGVG